MLIKIINVINNTESFIDIIDVMSTEFKLITSEIQFVLMKKLLFYFKNNSHKLYISESMKDEIFKITYKYTFNNSLSVFAHI